MESEPLLRNRKEPSDKRTPECKGQWAIVTGANQPSIGFRTAERLAEMGYHVVLACRSEERGVSAIRRIQNRNRSASVHLLLVDLASLASVRAFVKSFRALQQQFTEKYSSQTVPLAVLVNNAGVGWGKKTEHTITVDGVERIFGINHLGPFLLTTSLLPELEAAEHARVVMVASSLHDQGSKSVFDLDTVHPASRKPDGDFDANFAYRRSKLCNILFAYELDRRLKAGGCTSVAVNAMSPGFIVESGLIRDAGCFGVFFLRCCLGGCLRVFGKSPCRTLEEGAEAEILCVTEEEAKIGGQYFVLTKDGEFKALASSAESKSLENANQLWEFSENIIIKNSSAHAQRDLDAPLRY